MPNLTPRQRVFLSELNDLAQQHGGPVHYSEVAACLDVNRFSAYDMLKVLEEKGMVSSSYALASRGSGPGRTQVLFAPTAQGIATLASNDERGTSLEEWTSFKARILERLRETGQANYGDLLRDILGRLPDRRRPLLFCAEMTAALLLNLARVRARITSVNLLDVLSGLTAVGEAGLGTLAGLSLGSALNVASDHRLLEALYANVQRYQETIHGLNEESQCRLSEFLQEAIRAMSGRQRAA
jgi:Mn-dependent DtxR family transcriptional regulator